MSEDITSLYGELKALNCVLQFVRSGRVAITTSCFERVNAVSYTHLDVYKRQVRHIVRKPYLPEW